MSKRSALFFLVLCIILGAALRGYHLTARSLWFDEAFSWRLIQFPWTEMIVRDAADVHPPLYYIVLKGWSIVFGASLVSLRSLSVTLAAATIGSMYLFVSSAFKSRSTGLIAALLLAISGWQIQFAWEARMYTLGTMLVLLSAWALLHAIRREPQSVRWWLVYAGLATALAYVHYYAFFTIAAHVLFVVGYLAVTTRGRIGELMQSRRLWYALGAALIAVSLYMPWLPTFLRQNSQVQTSYWIGSLEALTVPTTLYHMFIPSTGRPQHTSLGWHLVVFIPLGLTALFGLLNSRRAHSRSSDPATDARWLVAALVVVPFILSVGLSLVSQSLYQDRFFVFAHLFILVVLADILMNIPWMWLRRVAIGAVIVSFAAASLHFWIVLDITHRPGARAATAYIFDQQPTDEPIIVSSPYVYFAILHYMQEEHHGPEPRLYSETGELSHFAGGPILKASDLTGPSVFSGDHSTLWVIDTTGFGGSPLAVPAPWQVQETRSYPEVFEHQGEVSVTKYVRQ